MNILGQKSRAHTDVIDSLVCSGSTEVPRQKASKAQVLQDTRWSLLNWIALVTLRLLPLSNRRITHPAIPGSWIAKRRKYDIHTRPGLCIRLPVNTVQHRLSVCFQPSYPGAIRELNHRAFEFNH